MFAAAPTNGGTRSRSRYAHTPVTVYALLVGINSYPPGNLPNLSGCLNDIDAMSAVLNAIVPATELSLVTLRDRQATRSAVVRAFREHLGQAGPGDTAIFHFSGHGSRDPNGPGLHETVVLYDSRQSDGRDLADRELGLLVAEVAGRSAHVVVVLDCCHAGSGTRDADQRDTTVRVIPPDPRPRTYLPGAEAATPRTRSLRNWSAITVDHVLLAACRPEQKAREKAIDGQCRGVFTAALQSALTDAPTLTYYQLNQCVVSTVRRWQVQDQDPRLELVCASDGNLRFLDMATDGSTLTPHVLSHDEDNGWTVDIGSLHGVPSPTENSTTRFAFHTLNFGSSNPLAVGEATEVACGRSRVRVDPPNALDPATGYLAVVTDLPRPPASVTVIGDSTEAQELRDCLAATFTVVDGTGERAVLVRAEGSTCTVTHPAAHETARLTFDGPGAVERVHAAVHGIAEWLRLRGLCNPSSSLPTDAVTVELLDPWGNYHRDRVRLTYPALSFEIRLTNTTARRLWCAIIDLAPDFRVFTDAIESGSIVIEAGAQEVVKVRAEIPDKLRHLGAAELDDLVKLAVSTSDFDPRQVATARPTTVREIRRIRTGSCSSSGWTTHDLVVTTVHPLV
jgi:hypothetical protein